MIGRLSPETTIEIAREQAAAAFDRVAPIERGGLTFTAVVFPGLSATVGPENPRMRELFWMASAGSALLLILACANAAGLLISRNLARRREAALKAALGASRVRLFRELLTEVAGIGLVAAGAGLATAALLTSLFRTLRLAAYMPPLEDLTFDWRVWTFAAGAAMLTVLLAGGVPSAFAARTDPQTGLRHCARGASRSGRVRPALTMVQVALSLALVASAAILGQSVLHLQSVSLGFDPQHLYTIDLRPRDVGREPARPFFDQVQQRLSEAPGVEAVAFSQFHHIGSGLLTEVQLTPDGPAVMFYEHPVSANYLRVLGIPLLSGRMLTPAETEGSSIESPVVLDELMARQLFGDASPIGQAIYTTYPTLHRREVIGVAGSSMTKNLRAGRVPSMYSAAGDLRVATINVRSSLPPAEAAKTIRGVVREVEPRLAAEEIATIDVIINELSAEERVLARLALTLAALALGLAIAGIYAAVASGVHERTREFGIRMALGASRPAVGREVVGRTLVPVAAGLTAGMALYAWASRFLEARLFGVSSLDPLMIAGACGVLLIAAVVAAWIPARRATRVDPTIALLAE